ncbi:MAG: GIY-YIG nuclease family protein [Sulfurimicrobium sp.]|nr:GIY-YIG nuclease family protein [Sulfurimicrobium sp.]MDP3688749.1 GIY-YIG nuclease family protein [Sulfurimicrobium sp.]MDZ7656857.1 GIY-YIG nuclease family protein [Sulfurimicrobium sp.]
MSWLCYLLECADGTLYTGITNDLEKRLSAHNAGTGSKYTRSRLPVRLLYSEHHTDRASASRRERALKKLSRAAKLALIANAADRSWTS